MRNDIMIRDIPDNKSIYGQHIHQYLILSSDARKRQPLPQEQ